MSWYWWVLIYVAGALMAFRVSFLNELDDYQRALHKWATTPTHDRRSRHTIEEDRKFGNIRIGLITVFWPISLVVALAWLLSQGVFWLMFPRGVRTKFDREQQLEREKKEAEQKFNEARELLAREGITV